MWTRPYTIYELLQRFYWFVAKTTILFIFFHTVKAKQENKKIKQKTLQGFIAIHIS